MFRKSIFLSIFIASLFVNPALAQEKSAWEIDLQKQLKTELQCTLLYSTSVFESEIAGKKTISGRAHCRDTRAFDFSRPSSVSPFKFKNCEPVVC